MGLTAVYTDLRTGLESAENHVGELEGIVRKLNLEYVFGDIIKALYSRARENKINADSLYEESITDEVTGLKNRKYYTERLKYYESEPDLACLLTDIDHFKKYNDSYGHLQGDQALRAVADAVKRYGGSEDAFRYGGEEYILFFVNQRYTSEALASLGEQIRKAVEETMIPILEDELQTTEEYPRGIRHVAISIGGAIRQEGETLEQLIRRADQALYDAKKTRNTVKISE